MSVAHQERAVGPVADELPVVPALRDHDAGQAQRERAVGARAARAATDPPGRPRPARRGSTTTSAAPRAFISATAVAWAR